MKFLVDSNVLSEATKPSPDRSVIEWLGANETAFAISPIVLGELEAGILVLPNGKRRHRLMSWFVDGISAIPVLKFDGETAHIWASLLASLGRKGRAMPIKDSLIAASAMQHDLTLSTRNVDDYRHCGVRLVNPFASK